MRSQIDGSRLLLFTLPSLSTKRIGLEEEVATSPEIFPFEKFPALHRHPLSWEKDAPADGGALLAIFLSSISSFFVSSSISGGSGKL